MSAYLEGELPAATRAALAAHVEACAPCRAVLEDLQALVVEARSLGDSEPSRDLWPDIAQAIGGADTQGRGGAGDDVIQLFEARRTAPPVSGVQFTIPQLAAASVALVLASAAITWWVGPGVAPRAEGTPPPESPAAFVEDVGGPPPDLASELQELERVLEVARSRLDPNTARILEKNLGVIERAIDESKRALTVDPGNAFLMNHLDRAYREKATYLREAASIAEWIG
jgi:hypothetical protein